MIKRLLICVVALGLAGCANMTPEQRKDIRQRVYIGLAGAAVGYAIADDEGDTFITNNHTTVNEGDCKGRCR